MRKKTMKKAGVKKKTPTKAMGGTMKKAGVMKKRPPGMRGGSKKQPMPMKRGKMVKKKT